MTAFKPEDRSPASQRGFAAVAPADAGAVRLLPLGLLSGLRAERAVEEGLALPLASGPFAFSLVEAFARAADGSVISAIGPVAEARCWEGELRKLSTPRAPWAGFALDKPLVMGVINVTPDSFSDGGDHLASDRAIASGRAMLEQGADIVDVGGESTRPGADPVSAEEEMARVLPVIRALAEAGAAVSIDTRHAAIMEAALAAGARILNDITALTGDPGSLAVAARTKAPLVLMHMQGEPRTMQKEPHYIDPALDVLDYLEARIQACEAAGIDRASIVVDPGIGFGKKQLSHNLPLLSRLGLLHGTGCAILLGVSRKSFIGRLGHAPEPKDRMPGSVSAGLTGLDRGVQILRVHDVAETRQAVDVWRAIVVS